MAILVTGGAGYVGSHTVRLLAEQGRDVVVLDSMEFGHREAVIGARLVVGDVRDEGLVSQLILDHHVDGVIHFAGYKAAGESMEHPARYFDNNVAATLALLGTVDRLGVHRFVFSSTCAVYGTPEELPVSETSPVHPESPYGESKRMVEQALHWLDELRGLQFVSLRYFNAAGASLDGRIGEDWTVSINLVPLAIKAALGRREPLKIFGSDYPTPDGTAVSDYIHVLDLADAHARALAYLERGRASASLNLGTGNGSSVLDVIRELERVSGRPVPNELVGRRPGDPVAVWADNRRACELLGWEPRFGLREIIETAWQWHSANLDGYPDKDQPLDALNTSE